MLEKLLYNIDKGYRGSVLNDGASDREIADAESKIGLKFPETLKQLYREANGESGALRRCPTRPYMLFDEFEFLSLDEVINTHRAQLNFEDDEILEGGLLSRPTGYIKLSFFNRSWIPIGWAGSNFYAAIDMDPGTLGKEGQVIVFGGMILPDLFLASPNLLQFINDISTFVTDYQANGTEEDASYHGLLMDLHR